MRLPKFLTTEIVDRYIRENFRRLNAFLELPGTQLVGFQHMEITISAPGENIKVPHNLGFVPRDVIVSRASGPGLIQFNYASFTATDLDLSVVAGTPTRADPSILRIYVGTHQEEGL
jgi:hypothetical protein